MPTYSLSVQCPYCHKITVSVRVNGSPQHWICNNPECQRGQTVSICPDPPRMSAPVEVRKA